MIRVLIFSFSCSALVACTSPQTIPVPPDLASPESWNDLSNVTVGGSECPLVRGKYREPPQKISTPESPFYVKDLEMLTFMGLMPFHLGTKEVISKVLSERRSTIFELFQNSSETFSVRFENLNSEVVQYKFELETVKYECKSGLMYFPLIGRFGADQTGSFNIQYQEIMATDTAENLVLIRISGPYKQTILTGNREFQYDFYRYPRVK